VLGRAATDRDLSILRRSLEKQLDGFTTDPDGAKALLLIGEKPHSESLDPVEHAAWTSVCLAILNLDEALTRE
jgi:hypothetical protein